MPADAPTVRTHLLTEAKKPGGWRIWVCRYCGDQFGGCDDVQRIEREPCGTRSDLDVDHPDARFIAAPEVLCLGWVVEREAWLNDHRFDLATALRLANEALPNLRINGLTPVDIIARKEASRG